MLTKSTNECVPLLTELCDVSGLVICRYCLMKIYSTVQNFCL